MDSVQQPMVEPNRPPGEWFSFCPRCGAAATAPPAGRAFQCAACGFRLYFNAASAAAVLLLDTNGRALFLRRARDPGRGKFGLPGGFADPGESAEETVRREVREEVGLEVGALEYLCSFPNRYPYAGVVYPVLDLFFVGHLAEASGTVTTQADEVADAVWMDPATVDPDEIAFPSMRAAVRRYLARTAPPASS